jgi:hypothetical protein
MRYTAIVICTIIALVSCKGTNSSKPILEVENRVLNMGTIHLDSSYGITYRMKNAGQADLIIDTVSSSCECTVPHSSKRIVQPSDTFAILVTYKPVDPGRFNKSVVVKSNIDSVFTVLSFRGTIIK